MAIDWDGALIRIVDASSTSYESRLHRQIFFAGLVALALIIFYKVVR